MASEIPSSRSGHQAFLPDDAVGLVFALFAVQHRDAAPGPHLGRMRSLFGGAHAPLRLERLRHQHRAGYRDEILVAYWLEAPGHTRYSDWWARPEVRQWWNSLEEDESVGHWREITRTPGDRFEYMGSENLRSGAAAFLNMGPSHLAGYWGAKRDRIPASRSDHFDSPVQDLRYAAAKTETRHRVSIKPAANVCLTRNGQWWGHVAPRTLATWRKYVEPELNGWLAFLTENPLETHCLSLRDCRPLDPDTGEALPGRTQLTHMLSLARLEELARTTPVHLRLRDAFLHVRAEDPDSTQVNAWVETHITLPDAVELEYVNCHPLTGLLRWSSDDHRPAPRA